MIYECIYIPTFTLLLNGSPLGYFDSNGDIRQGDPLSPFLFSIAMEYFTILLDIEFYEGHTVLLFTIEPTLTHLL